MADRRCVVEALIALRRLTLDATRLRIHHLRTMSRDTAKALVIICGMIAFGIALLVWANHVRPHGY